MRETDFQLCLVTDRHQCTSPALQRDTAVSRLEHAIELACRAGLRAVQVREKDLDSRATLSLVERLRSVTSRYDCRLIINDRVDIAIASGIDAVHCPENGFPPSTVRELLGPRSRVGASSHSLESARRAVESGADWIFFGPVYETPSKERFGPPAGIDRLREVCEALDRPVFAIGGITASRARDCIAAGAAGIGVVSAILSSLDPMTAVSKFETVLGSL